LTTTEVARRITTSSPQETENLGRRLGERLEPGVSVGLVGPLGAGKTQFVKGVARGNAGGTSCDVTSPTFTLIHEYAGKLTLYHLDSYRLAGPKEMKALGLDELVRSDSAVVVEWADRVRSVMPLDTLWISFAVVGDTARELQFEAGGSLAAATLARMSA